MTRFYQVGPDTLGDGDFASVPGDRAWVVYWYKSGSYDGSGLAAAGCPDGSIEVISLAHCSCYGPARNWNTHAANYDRATFLTLNTRDEIIPSRCRDPLDHDYLHWQAVVAGVRALISNKEKP